MNRFEQSNQNYYQIDCELNALSMTWIGIEWIFINHVLITLSDIFWCSDCVHEQYWQYSSVSWNHWFSECIECMVWIERSFIWLVIEKESIKDNKFEICLVWIDWRLNQHNLYTTQPPIVLSDSLVVTAMDTSVTCDPTQTDAMEQFCSITGIRQ